MIQWVYRRREQQKLREAEKWRRLEEAEAELRDVKSRARRVGVYLGARQKRNHWQEAINQIISGG